MDEVQVLLALEVVIWVVAAGVSLLEPVKVLVDKVLLDLSLWSLPMFV